MILLSCNNSDKKKQSYWRLIRMGLEIGKALYVAWKTMAWSKLYLVVQHDKMVGGGVGNVFKIQPRQGL